MAKTRITLWLCCFLLALGQFLNAQKTIVLPLEVGYFNDYDQTRQTGQTNFMEALIAKVNAVPDTETIDQLRPALQQVVDQSAKGLGGEILVLHPEDLTGELEEAYRAALPYLKVSSKGGILNGRRYDEAVSTRNAPFLNQLCDAFGGDRVVLIRVSATNELPFEQKDKKDPKGSLWIFSTLFDGNSGLVLKQKRKSKGNSENLPIPYKLTAESIAKQLDGTLRQIL